MDHYVGEFLIFFATIDPIGTLALFVGLTAGLTDEDRRAVAFRSIGYASLNLVTAMVAGQLLLGALGIGGAQPGAHHPESPLGGGRHRGHACAPDGAECLLRRGRALPVCLSARLMSSRSM